VPRHGEGRIVSGYAAYTRWYAGWLWWSARTAVRELWDGIPGPLWVKILVMCVLAVTLVTPGPDELIIVFALRLAAKRGRKRNS
jgi:hypothetical protein